MQVIVTHENTDFDGLASLVAAARLYPAAIAILPRKLNRNAQSFVTFYQEQLPLRSADDLPNEPITNVILVDSQSPGQMPGIDEGTSFLVLDHHPVERPLPNARYELDATGAATTMLVERLIEAGLPLTPVEATLFLLGIYEDTGRLSYGATTSRDLRAAAFLLDAGASLKAADRFLTYPLTGELRSLYNNLVQSLETVQIEGETIAIASAAAEHYIEEVSVLAHRLMDLFEPDALLMLVAMDDHVQLVARSSNGAVDVGQIAARLGGGGHQRAAAALVRGLTLAQVRQQLLELLPQVVRPATRVSQIMSFGVHVLSPDTKVAEAAELMQRYGHEGFPVVDSGQLVGIITRREIDRAMQHGLFRAPVRVYMRAEGVAVSPEAGVHEVQRLMTEHGIGQVPVVEDGKVIGIVTRTDLIKLWAAEREPSPALNVAGELRRALPEPVWQLLQSAAAAATQRGYGLYVVGGFVRDLLLHQPNLDLDLVVEGDAARLAQALSEAYGGSVRSHRRFGTAKWLLSEVWRQRGLTAVNGLPEHIDFASARTEFYEHPSSLPVVERSSIKQDLHRRDFTINTLAVCLNAERLGEVLDFFGGLKDLNLGLIRVLHNLSFVEDPTRILRALRLEARLGFRIEPRTANLIKDAVVLLRRTSGERLAHELVLILEEEAPEKVLARLRDFGALEQLGPGLHFDEDIAEAMRQARAQADAWPLPRHDLPQVYLCLLAWRADKDELADLVTRLHLPRDLAGPLRDLVPLRGTLSALATPDLLPSQAYERLHNYGPASLLAAFAISKEEAVRSRLLSYQREWSHVKPLIGGAFLRSLGLKPGPIYREILENLRRAKLDGQALDEEGEKALVRRWLAEGRFQQMLEGAKA